MAPESSPPPIEVQKSFWNSWNTEWRSGELDHFMRRQAEVALEVARSEHLRHSRILEVGCGVGWLGNELREFGDVTGVDLSPTAIDFGRQRFPEITLLCSDFLAAEFPDEFDLIVSADSLAHVPDHRLYLEKIARLLRPGGTFLLMTQNPFVWDRRSRMKPVETGQIQKWPTKRQIMELLADDFEIERTGSLDPGGDRGVLFWVERRPTRALRRLVGERRWDRLLERFYIGRELVIRARRITGDQE